MTTNRFASAMTSRTDAELVAIVSGPVDDWEPDAVAAAHAEIARRDLGAERRAELEAEWAEEARLARAPLDRWMKGIAFVVGLAGVLGILVLFLHRRFEKGREKRKAKELLTWFFYGVGLHFAVIMLAACRR